MDSGWTLPRAHSLLRPVTRMWIRRAGFHLLLSLLPALPTITCQTCGAFSSREQFHRCSSSAEMGEDLVIGLKQSLELVAERVLLGIQHDRPGGRIGFAPGMDSAVVSDLKRASAGRDLRAINALTGIVSAAIGANGYPAMPEIGVKRALQRVQPVRDLPRGEIPLAVQRLRRHGGRFRLGRDALWRRSQHRGHPACSRSTG